MRTHHGSANVSVCPGGRDLYAGPDPRVSEQPFPRFRESACDNLAATVAASDLELGSQADDPRIHLIPGTLGSQLSRNSGDQDLPFWGTITIKNLVKDNPAFKYTEGEVVTAKGFGQILSSSQEKYRRLRKPYMELQLITGSPESVFAARL
jgi:hypothetical protein